MRKFEDALSEGLALVAERGSNAKQRRNFAPQTQKMPYSDEEVENDEEKKKKKKLGSQERPSAPMVFALVTDATIVGNPDVGDYQPDMYGGSIPPALIPLHMNHVHLQVQCYVNVAFVTVSGSWRLHCIKNGRSCDCVLTLPMHEQGTLSSVEIEMDGKMLVAQPIPIDDASQHGHKGKLEDYEVYSPYLISLRIPKVTAGASLSVKVTWLQCLTFFNGSYSISVPFIFPKYVVPSKKSLSDIAMISFSVNAGAQKQISMGSFSHPMKEQFHQLGVVNFSQNSEAGDLTNADFVASYKVLSTDLWASLLVQDESNLGFEKHRKFCLFLLPPSSPLVQVSSNRVIFLLDRSGSMHGKPMEEAIEAITFCLSKLNAIDCFNIIAFNHERVSFSSHLQFATPDTLNNARLWLNQNCQAHGGTNILEPVNQAFDMLSKTEIAIPQIFLITDGAVEDEHHICQIVQALISNGGSKHPRLFTFGIGPHCNHYFLQLLALIGKGTCESTFSKGLIRSRMERMILATSSALLSNISIGISRDTEEHKVDLYSIPDLYAGNPIIISGKFSGKLPDRVKIYGTLPNTTTTVLDVEAQKADQMLVDQIFAKQQLPILTSQAWLTGNKLFTDQAIQLSLSAGLPSEYTRMALFETDKAKYSLLMEQRKKEAKIDLHKYLSTKTGKIATLRGLALGFGSVSATMANSTFDDGEKVLSEFLKDSHQTLCCQITCGDCCSSCDLGPLGDCCCCCSCCGPETTGTCSRMWDTCAVVGAQACISAITLCCCELCLRF